MSSPKAAMKKSAKKSVADKYQRKTQHQHILDRPNTYIGSTDVVEQSLFIYDDTSSKIKRKIMNFVPGLNRIYEEVLLNAYDQTVRADTGITTIKIDIDKEAGSITVWNDGDGIPVVQKTLAKENGKGEENLWVPELIFGSLFTSSNYNDNEKRITGGVNGLGSKLTNIFSTEFTVETCCKDEKKKFKMTWSNNMTKKSKAKVTKFTTKKTYTKVTFKPDFKRFNLTGLTDDIVAYMKKRAYDIAFNTRKGISVYYNKEKIPIKKMTDYMKMYIPDDDDRKMIVDEDNNNRWEVGLFMSDESFEQVSFVNGINTNQGGAHVDYVSKKIIKYYSDVILKKTKVKASYIKDKMFVFVKSSIENPEFESQTKEKMSKQASKFGSTWEPVKKFLNGLKSLGIAEEVKQFAKFKESKELQKTDGKIKKTVRIPKLEDANWAGTKKSNQCSLILTEGDSAKTFAVSGLALIGRDKYGVFPLKGKLLNVKDQSSSKILNNQEITNLKQILGLKQGHKYKSLDETRYGGVIILTDQDVDGSHIKGLVMNMFHTFWPELLKMGYVKSLITPIVKVSKGKGDNAEVISFYTLTDYENWKKKQLKGWTTKYYKGLGTSKASEAKECMRDIEQKLVTYTWNDFTNSAINLGFSKDKADARKKWLLNYDRENIIDQTVKSIPINDFINKDLIHFSSYDNHRSIPSVVDGFKPTQRKILYTGLKYLTNSEIKVAQFSGKVGEKTDYHHGEQSIVTTVVGMAQNFVGSNNCNLFLPNGQFGTRLQGGKDRSSERYIFTNTAPITKKIFSKNDDVLLNYLDSDGQQIEPEYYVPSVPMILVNGTTGIGTGFSTQVLPHKMSDVITAIRNKLDGKKVDTLKPFYRNFEGEIKTIGPKKYTSNGNYTIDEKKGVITITELPVGVWTENYKIFLESSVLDRSASEKDKKKQFAKNIENHSTDSKVKFIVTIIPDVFKKMIKKGDTEIRKILKLTSNLSETNMYLFDKDGKIKKFKTAEEILNYYYDIRLHYYDLRKKKMIEVLAARVAELQNKVRFIRMVKAKKIDVLNTTDEKLDKDLTKHNFLKIKNSKNEYSYDYLTNMAIRTLTLERANKMEKEYKELQGQLEALKKKTIKSMWLDDLVEIENENIKYNNDLKASVMCEEVVKSTGKKRKVRKTKKSKK